MYKKKLAAITRTIIHSTTIEEEIDSVKALSVFFYELFLKELPSPAKNNEILLQGGIALSSFDASICVDDYLRTARFLKGINNAIKLLQARFPGQKINILYAGCGPYATLLLPLMPLFDTAEIGAILLDINNASINSVKNILSITEMEEYDIQVLQTDALIYKKSESWPMHLLITETMFNALIREPQTAVTMNLAPQLIPGGILIPEEINLDLVYTFFAKEPFLKNEKEQSLSSPDFLIPAYPHRIIADRIFSLNKELCFSDKSETDSYIFKSKNFALPADISLCPDICIFTQLWVFQDIELNAAQSYITNPYCVTSIHKITDHTSFQLVYNFKDIPNWTYELKE